MRHPASWPSQVMAGTPTTLAMVSPESTSATPRPRFPGPMRLAATSDAMPKYAPCGRAATKRAATTSSNVGSRADATVPIVNAAARASSSCLRGHRAAAAAIVGAPTTTPSAYAEMIQPAAAFAASVEVAASPGRRSAAMSGRSPMATNSVAPMPKPPIARAMSASRVRAGERGVGACGRGVTRTILPRIESIRQPTASARSQSPSAGAAAHDGAAASVSRRSRWPPRGGPPCPRARSSSPGGCRPSAPATPASRSRRRPRSPP